MFQVHFKTLLIYWSVVVVVFIGRKFNFKKQKASIIDSFGTKYDYKSIMHYGAYTFSKNKKPVMITKDPSMQKVIGQRIKLSEIDKEQINKMYNCHIGKSWH